MIEKGTIINSRYELKEYIGSGTFGEVWLAQDTRTGINVALKIYIALNDSNAAEFLKEYQTAYGLRHTNLLTADYFDIWERRPFLIMKYCPNGSLAGRVRQMSERDMWTFLRDVASGLEFLHSQKPDPIVHQDIKPDNILVDEQGRYLITDFGISKRIRSSLRKMSTTNTSAGSMPYMAPERFSAEPTPVKASDIWSLGATIYELATGDLPFSGMGGGMQAAGAEIPKLPKEFSQALNDTMRACLAKETWDRPQAAQLCSTAQKMLDDEKPEAPWLGKAPKTEGQKTQRQVKPQPTPPPIVEPDPQKPEGGKDISTRTGCIVTAIVVLAFGLIMTLVQKCEQQRSYRYSSTTTTTTTDEETTPATEATESSQQSTATTATTASTSNKTNTTQTQTQTTKPRNVINGHKYVDLGLSVKWATGNIGAQTPADYGNYYAWGEITTKSSYDSDNSLTYGDSSFGDISGNAKYDAARANWGGSWRMPTKAECEELVNKCEWTWTTQTNSKGEAINCYKVTGPNGNSIFLPAAGGRYGSSLNNAGEWGFYWSSQPGEGGSGDAYSLYFYRSAHYVSWSRRYRGYSLRPVSE